jgi:type IV pilus assembly protein PilX
MKNTFMFSLAVRRKQGGVSLIIAMVALVAMTFAGLALIRAVDTTNLISGNLAFRQATLLTTDVGVETALTNLSTIVTTSLDANWPAGCATGACNYYPIKQAVTAATGVPTTIDWSLVPTATVDTSYSVQYVIDRLCDGPAPVTDITTKCMRTTATTVGTKTQGTSFSGASQVYYRATIRVLGPRNTVSMTQALFAR